MYVTECVYVCLCVSMCTVCLRVPVETRRSLHYPRSGVMGSREPLNMDAENQTKI